MKISIVTATYNSGSTLRETLESVLAQDYAEYEHIIVDGVSKDATLEIIHQYEHRYGGRLRYISEPDNGIYDAMNKGIEMAKGDVIGILNSDDFFSDKTVLGRIAVGIRDVDIIYGNLDFVDAKNTDKVVRQWIGSQYYSKAFLKGWHPAHPTFYARRECFEKFGKFDITFDVSADFELMFRFIERFMSSNKYIPYTLVKMRVGGVSTGSISKIIKGNKNVLKAFRKNGFKAPWFYTIRRLTTKAIGLIKSKLRIY